MYYFVYICIQIIYTNIYNTYFSGIYIYILPLLSTRVIDGSAVECRSFRELATIRMQSNLLENNL